ncbi:MAG: ESPR domain-containing protein, partial [Paraburkholderia sp.]
MNKNRFRTIFSKRLGMLVAVEETATSQGKRPGEGAGADAGAADVEFGVVSIMKALAAALMATGATVSFAQSLPTNGQVAAGQASISQNANTMT